MQLQLPIILNFKGEKRNMFQTQIVAIERIQGYVRICMSAVETKNRKALWYNMITSLS